MTRNEAAKCSPWFPPLGPPVGSALPSPGSAEVRSPASTVLWRCATPCAPLAALRCLRLAIPCGAPVVSLPAVQDARPRAWGSSSGPHNRKVAAGRQSGPPRFPGNPLSLCPVLRPRQDRTHQAITVQSTRPPLCPRRRLPRCIQLSRLNRTALGLAVYASPGALPHTTQNSLPAAGQALPGGDWCPAGLLRNVSDSDRPPFTSLPGRGQTRRIRATMTRHPATDGGPFSLCKLGNNVGSLFPDLDGKLKLLLHPQAPRRYD